VRSISALSEKLFETYLKQNKPHGKAWKNDVRDAILCALVALLYRQSREQLVAPDSSADLTEGWIWLPVATATIRPR
jgi:predicted RNase H-like nuclease